MKVLLSSSLSLFLSFASFVSQANIQLTESKSTGIMSNAVPVDNSNNVTKPQIVSAYFDEVWNDTYQDLDYDESVFHFSFTCGDFDVAKCIICIFNGPCTWETINKVGDNYAYPTEFESFEDGVWTFKMVGITWGEFFYIGIHDGSKWGGWSDWRLSTDYLSDDFIKKINESFDNILSIDEIGNDEIGFVKDAQTISFTGDASRISRVSLLNISGVMVHQQSNSEPINTSFCSNGVYILVINTHFGESIVHKIIL